MNPRIRWRRREFRLRWGGTAESCEIPADEENPLSGIEEGNPENVNNNEIEKKSLQLLLSQPPSDLVSEGLFVLKVQNAEFAGLETKEKY